MKRRTLFLTIALLIVTATSAQAQSKSDGVKFGFFDIANPALGLSREITPITRRLNLNFDGEVIFDAPVWLITDLSLKYFPRTRTRVQPYFGGGMGISLGDDNGVPAHFVGGINFKFDHLPAFVEAKAHLSNPSALTLWIGIRY